MIQTKVDELKTELAAKRTQRALEQKALDRKLTTIAALQGFIDHIDAQIVRIEKQLAREDTVLVRDRGACVELEHADGTIWQV